MYYYGSGTNGCGYNNNYPYPYYPIYPTYYGNNNSAIIIVLFILLVIIIGSSVRGR